MRYIFSLYLFFCGALAVTPQGFTAELRERVPANAAGYLRIPQPWEIFASPKGGPMDKILSDNKIESSLKKLREQFFGSLQEDVPASARPVVEMILMHCRGPLESVWLLPENAPLPIPEVWIEAQMNFENRGQVEELLKRLVEAPGSVVELDGAMDEKGFASLILPGGVAAFLHFDESRKRLSVLTGKSAQRTRLEGLLDAPLAPEDHPMYRSEKKLDESRQGLFLWINAELLEPMARSGMPPQQWEMMSKWGLDSLKGIAAGWGIVGGKGRFGLVVDAPKAGYRKVMPEIKNQLELSSTGRAEAAVNLNFQPEAWFEAALIIYSSERGEQKELQEKLTSFEETLGMPLAQTLSIFGPEFCFFFDEVGEYAATRLRDKKGFDQLLKLLEDRFAAKHEEKNVEGVVLHHLKVKHALEIPMLAMISPVLFKLAMAASNTHLYWVQDGNFLIFSRVPQGLVDRLKHPERVELQKWMRDSQGVDPALSLISGTVHLNKLPRRVYYAWLGLLQFMSDYCDGDLSLLELPSAQELGLTEDGALGFILEQDGPLNTWALVFENSPFDAMLTDQSSLTTVATVAIVAGMLMPALGKAKHAAQHTQRANDLKQIVQSVLIAENATNNSTLSEKFSQPGGIETAITFDSNEFKLDGKAPGEEALSDPAFATFRELKGAHPHGGTYIFLGVDFDGNSKERYSSTSRWAMERYDWEEGDGKVGIAFGDGHVEFFDAPEFPLEIEDIMKILSVQGDGSLWGE